MVTQEVTRLFRKCEAQLQRFGEQRSTSEADEKVHPAVAVLMSVSGLKVGTGETLALPGRQIFQWQMCSAISEREMCGQFAHCFDMIWTGTFT